MAPPPGDTDRLQAEGRDAFVRQLPKRIAAIEEIWSRLENGTWDTEQLSALYKRVREISDSSKTYSLFQLNESVFSLEVYVSSFVDSDVIPGPSQVESISGLVRTLKTAANITAADEADNAGESSEARIFVFGPAESPARELIDTLRRRQCDVSSFDDIDALIVHLQSHPPRVIVADTSMLPEIGPLSDELTRLRSHLSVDISLIFVSRSTSLQLRVDAIRAGGDGYLVAPLDADQVAAQIYEMATPGSQTPYRVLVVEDDPTQADFAASILQKAGIEVMQVIEPVKALDRLREFHPDLILMDIYMPEVNGIELTSVIRSHMEFVAIPIVFLSGEQSADKQLHALSVGGDDFIAKPIRPKHLLSIVQARIRRARQLLSVTGQPPKHDRLTGLMSRQHLLDQTAAAIDSYSGDRPAAVVVIKPDDDNALNEQLGIGGVDHLMSQIGDLIASELEPTDTAARLDERSFGILLHRDNAHALEDFAQRISDKIGAADFHCDADCKACVGLCAIDDRLDDANGVVARATHACGEPQRESEQIAPIDDVDIDSEDDEPVTDDDLPQRLKAALHNDSLVILYQPLLDLHARGNETYETVLRVENSHGDLVGDKTLLSAARQADVCEELDQWIAERALSILKQRRESGRRTRIFVHQSATSALNVDMPAWLLGRLRTKQMVGTGLVVDFRLPDLSQDLKIAKKNIRALREMDIEVSLSRFPEKDAAFKVLRYLHANYVNIAPRLLKADRRTISNIIRLAHDGEAKVIVSNIDDPRSIDLHWSSGADFLQGNFIQRPLENMDYDFSQVVI